MVGVTDDAGCQGSGQESPATTTDPRPWAGSPRADDHDRLARFLRETPDGAPIIWYARRLFGDDVTSVDKDWKFVERHGERHHAIVRPTNTVAVRTADGNYDNRQTEPHFTWLFPRFDATADVLDVTVSGITRDGPDESRVSTAAAKARGILSDDTTLTQTTQWGALVGSLAAKRTGEERGATHRTRFNDVSRARQSANRVEQAFAGASATGHTEGAIVTPTTDATRYDHVGDAAAEVIEDVSLLRRWLGSPPGITCVEPTNTSGLPHAHVPLFLPHFDLPTRRECHDYWHEHRGRGYEVWIDPIEYDGEAWVWAEDGPADGTGRSPRTYTKKGAMALTQTTRYDAATLHDVAAAYRDRDVELTTNTVDAVDAAVSDETGVNAKAIRWAAWYFATDLKATTRPSKPLRDAAGGDPADA